MPAYRRAANVDSNQGDIVDALRSIPGVQVELEHDDIIVGYQGNNYWFEIKNPNVANKKGKVFNSAKKKKQRALEQSWPGHYRIVTSLEEILADMGIQSSRQKV